MNKTLIILILSIPCLLHNLYGQDSLNRKVTLNGYLSFTESALYLNFPDKEWIWESLLHNRLNFNYYPSDNFSFSFQLRNRLIAGDRFKRDVFHFTERSISGDAGMADLSWNVATGRSYVLNSAIDRLWIKYARNNLEITAGRQRINWGLTYVWNVNDWFNNYSFFDVDYLERPGSDALRVQYFTGAVSGLEGVVKLDSTDQITAAGLYKTNIRQWDMQFLGGILSGEDAAVGFGWAGGLGRIGFRGEMSYLHPLKHMKDTTGLFFVSVALDYTFPNSLMIQAEGFYNQRPGGGEVSFFEFYSRPSSVKDLSFTELNFFAQVSYPFTPLLNASMAALFFPEVKGYYMGPSITYSLGDNLELAFILQYFTGDFPYLSGAEPTQEFTMGFGRLKWSF